MRLPKRGAWVASDGVTIQAAWDLNTPGAELNVGMPTRVEPDGTTGPLLDGAGVALDLTTALAAGQGTEWLRYGGGRAEAAKNADGSYSVVLVNPGGRKTPHPLFASLRAKPVLV